MVLNTLVFGFSNIYFVFYKTEINFLYLEEVWASFPELKYLLPRHRNAAVLSYFGFGKKNLDATQSLNF
jgi:hypothetical protein